MHPIGSWLVSWAIDEAPDLEFDYVNLPAMPAEAAGDQGSVIGVETGYMVNAKSPKHPGRPSSSWPSSTAPRTSRSSSRPR